VKIGVRGPNERLIGKPGSRHELGTPALVLDLDRLDANIASMAAHAKANGYGLRPPAKIHKSVEIARRQIAAGAVGLCCATLAEAEVMVAGGIPGVMLFSSVVTGPKLERLANLNQRTDDLVVVVDEVDNVKQLAAAARRSGQRLRLMVDFEVGGGRTGVADESQAVALARHISATEGLEYVGVQAYVGKHQKIVDYDERQKASRRDLAPLAHLVERLASENLRPRIVSGGGTGTHDIDPALGVFTEIQAGTYVFMDVKYRDVVLRRHEPHPFQPSLTVRATVISAAQPGFVVTDAGAKEVDGFFGVLAPQVYEGAPQGARYSIVGDDMGRVDFTSPTDRLEVGDVVTVLPPHCYQTVILHSVYHCVRGDELVDIWPIDALPSW
jgi:3-hydroxy-D-aspartate aldolase